jgi:hypothetical protein
MKVIPLGLQCAVPDGIKKANLREYSYPFDWLWCPSKTTYDILNILINESIDHAVEYMTTGYTYYRYMGNEHYESVEANITTESQMNSITGLGITHFTINDEYKNTLRTRLQRLIRDVQSNEDILFIYADAANRNSNYHLDGVEYGLDATEYLLKIHELIHPINNNIRIVYFCWNERKQDNNIIEYVPFDFVGHFSRVAELIAVYLTRRDGITFMV